MALRSLSLRHAVDWVRTHAPGDWSEPPCEFSREDIAAHYADTFAGVPANSVSREEKLVRYRVRDSPIPVLLGLYGSAERVRRLLPGLPPAFTAATARAVVNAAQPPTRTAEPPCRQVRGLTLHDLPALRATPRDAGPYLTMGLVYAEGHDTIALSVHRMLVLDSTRLAMWMIPGRALRALHEQAGGRLPVSVNLGAPPAAMVASALSSALLPTGKLDIAGALAGAPIALADAVSQPTSVLAESEIVIEGYLDTTTADEALSGPPAGSLPEFLGYDGDARTGLPVLTVTAVTTRRDPTFQAVIGPGREQSVILGLAGALSVALSADTDLISDLHYGPSGGGMLLLVVAVRKRSTEDDGRLGALARRIFEGHGFLKLIVFTDDDVDIRSTEDVFWAITTRANLGSDCATFTGFRPLGMDPSQRPEWGRGGAGDRTWVDATAPFARRGDVVRSFGPVGAR
ncbi:4-hydroxy-3-polyprenylbenzoate decarboxylase [Actinokineospora alba]|uniref:4-hydroxy-3-polyprenylbenzoate decarboxylase n=1 Tax=Actinokineospora alba TaxID=504798 RepID=A0A1H0R740_9PSEU|nr:UbiD family decarboxylase [Actinokineospora alba]TDP70232.1 4-hydroxy-3-polyprenylbenzoate decarboxylase [Actinokineospora alba]SDI36168.1 4-hydroxy-3-polyprenylbenzoate decarboxylase [Actinokineospora alba]SDP24959.1 4-hydroxy-3-polyprenylbenzoate decarboxylase [Actinokineospora alba]